ncbi:MAG: FadR/GntR family transcriptional regulator [Ilumatobacteraceae bacterium]
MSGAPAGASSDSASSVEETAAVAGDGQLDVGSRRLVVQPVLPAYLQVAAQLRELILSGNFGPGERLPVELDIGTLFGVSRSTVREALRTLSSQNLIVTSRGVRGGSYVVHPDPAAISEWLEANLGLLSGTHSLTVHDILETRVLLEVPAVGLAAKRRSEQHLKRLRSCIPTARADLDLGHRFEGNLQFHIAILEACDNSLLQVVTQPTFTILRTRFLRDQAPERFWKEVPEEHAGIYEAIEARDSVLAEERMRTHLSHLRAVYERIYRASKSESVSTE